MSLGTASRALGLLLAPVEVTVADNSRPGQSNPGVHSDTEPTDPLAFATPLESDPSRLKNTQMALLVGLSPQEELPGFATAFDEEAMKGYLRAALFGTGRPGYTVERCTPTKPL